MKRKLEQVELEEVELEFLELEQVELEVELEEGNSWPGPDIARAGSGSKSGGKGRYTARNTSRLPLLITIIKEVQASYRVVYLTGPNDR